MNDIITKQKEAFENIKKADEVIINTQKDELKMKDAKIKKLENQLKSAKEMVCGHAIAPNEEIFGPLCNKCGSAINQGIGDHIKGIETVKR